MIDNMLLQVVFDKYLIELDCSVTVGTHLNSKVLCTCKIILIIIISPKALPPSQEQKI